MSGSWGKKKKKSNDNSGVIGRECMGVGRFGPDVESETRPDSCPAFQPTAFPTNYHPTVSQTNFIWFIYPAQPNYLRPLVTWGASWGRFLSPPGDGPSSLDTTSPPLQELKLNP
jgi:hypothetical protein